MKYGMDLRGEFHTVEELQSIRLKYAKIANARLRSLERAERDVYAYDVATRYTERTRKSKRFSEAKKFSKNPRDLMRDIDALTQFLNSQTSTVRGQKKLENKKINSFEKKLEVTIPNKREFWNFLSGNSFQNLRGARKGDSNYFVDFYVRSKEEGYSLADINKALDEYRRGEVKGIDELFNKTGLSFIEDNTNAKILNRNSRRHRKKR